MVEIKEFQKYLEQEAPFNITYKTKKEGVMDSSLFFALKTLEEKIALNINNKAIIGMIISSEDRSIRAQLSDIKKAVELINGFNKYSQANLESLDVSLNEEKQSENKFNLTDEDALSQFYSVSPSDNQQPGVSQIDPPLKTAKIDERYIKLIKFL